ncbi:2-succinyl-5-enolpyruvyl-6-hydroxy-3-cyclohexene-1-carboxylic-acid synthase [Phormidium sp. CLA17]|uniref:2-succinyl-5-enolpyruvyl-6-hydroxy-3- cyclohexene-1-carboxylic-acid synthase n=1 Tax=Leptolyngbya sp. Cla-17 TaxID=2803751 RepID=UPI0014917D4A|nr:2-succinyl-5-enolpyruvyl-6-hydroxy-3-cyclohexene-1-carboxylic-acid synthase [Leptolyngbya sp. Cla-17]MBM0742472.1 2-succinyl-5-enolpyruvyl-6-hydroxy-3-cyclohexene-1-carboxylic-acid synthase [Leptolyngbya sp. Cla-17]
MAIDFTNTNLVWTSILVETLFRLGLKTAVICPGSRSAPLAIAFANHLDIDAIPVLDERSAAFFALGVARQQHQPVALICTSGTAGANFYPAVIEAYESRVPLLIFTADRPPELRDCNAGQAIDQQKLYGSFPNWYTELAIASVEPDLLAYLRQTIIHAWDRALFPVAGVVHLNVPLREPLAPVPEPHVQALAFNATDFFSALPSMPSPLSFSIPLLPIADWQASTHGIIIAGLAQPAAPEAYCRAIAALSSYLGYPVLAEGLSPLRNYADLIPNLISTYDLILRNAAWSEKLAPEIVLRIGDMPTSKQLRTWVSATQPRQWVIDSSGRNLDPLHGKTIHLHCSVEQLAAALAPSMQSTAQNLSPYWHLWQAAEIETRQNCDRTLSRTTDLFEGKAAWMLSRCLPPGTPLFISSSTPVRDVDFFWVPSNSRIQPLFNRGANGIDGSLSTALGIAHDNQSSVMLTGDLALLHDTNGFLLRQHFEGHLTIVLINNNGGGIFEMLAIAQYDLPFEKFFALPQSVDFAQLCKTYSVEHERITAWDQLADRLNPLPKSGIRVLELCTDRKADAQWRQQHLGTFAAKMND